MNRYVFDLILNLLNSDVSEIDVVKLDFGQYTDISGLTFDHLCLVSYAPLTTRYEGNGRHEGLLSFDLSLVSSNAFDSNRHVIDAVLETHQTIIDQVIVLMQGFEAKLSDVPGIGTVDTSNDYILLDNTDRKQVVQGVRQADYLETKLTFSSNYREMLGQKKYSPPGSAIGLNLTTQFQT